MSLKQKEEITIWAFKDGKKGHENQIDALIHELKLRKKVHVSEIDCSRGLKNWPKNFKKSPDILIGAGNKTHHFMLQVKNKLKAPKTIVLMRPSFKPTQLFNIAIVPEMDRYILYTPKNVLRTKGVLCRYYKIKPAPGTGIIVIGGNSKHYSFSKKLISYQLKMVLEKFSDIQWKVTTSPRSPNFDIPEHTGNAEFFNWKDVDKGWLTNAMSNSEYAIVTPDSVSSVYEALSTNSKTIVFQLDLHHNQHGQINTKVTKNIDLLKNNQEVGYVNVLRNGIFGKMQGIKINLPKERVPLEESKRVVDLLMDML